MPRFQGINGYVCKINIDDILKWILVVVVVASIISIIVVGVALLLFPKHERQRHHVQQPRQGHDARDDKARGIPCFGRGQGTRQPIETQTRHDLAQGDNGTPKGYTNENAPITSAVLPCVDIYNKSNSANVLLDSPKQTAK